MERHDKIEVTLLRDAPSTTAGEVRKTALTFSFLSLNQIGYVSHVLASSDDYGC